MRPILLLLVVIQSAYWSYGQKTSEFEGRIYYQNHFTIKSPGVDSNQLKQFFGTTSVYTYKQGNYLWTFEDCNMETELYLHENAQLLNKYKNKKYYISRDVVNEVDSLVSYTLVENADTICGYACNSIRVITQRVGTNNKLTRTLYFSTDLAIDPQHFKKYRSYAHWKVYQITRSVPLRIIIEDGSTPFIVEMVAEKVERTKLSDKTFKQNKSLPVKTYNDL